MRKLRRLLPSKELRNQALEKAKHAQATKEEELVELQKIQATAAGELSRAIATLDALAVRLRSQEASNEMLLAALTEAQHQLKAKDDEHGSLLRSLLAKAGAAPKKHGRSAKDKSI